MVSRLSRRTKLIVLCVLAVFMITSVAYAAIVQRWDKVQLGAAKQTSGLLNLESGTTAAKGIYFGTDTTLYRSAADTLKTDDSLIVTGTLTTGGVSYTTLTTTSTTNLGDGAGDAIGIVGTATFTPAATFTGGFTSTGTGTFNGDVNLGNGAPDAIAVLGTATFTPAATFTGGLTSTGTLAATNAATVGTTLGVTGATTLTGSLTANGACTLGDAAGDTVTVNGNTTHVGSLTAGNTTLNGTVAVGDASTDTCTMTGRLIVRFITATTAAGTQGEIAFCSGDSKFYGCTVTGGPSAATWVALH